MKEGLKTDRGQTHNSDSVKIHYNGTNQATYTECRADRVRQTDKHNYVKTD